MGKYFGTDGFRGEAGIDLTADHAYKVGRFLGWYYNMLRKRNGNSEPARIVIGKDTRRSSYMFEYSLVAGLTAFYMFRLYYLIFWWEENPEYKKEGHKPHDAPWQMSVPLLFLAAVSCVAGFIPFGEFVTYSGEPYEIHLETPVAVTSIVIALLAIGLATVMYAKKNPLPTKFKNAMPGLWKAAHHRFYWDEMYQFVTHKIIFNIICRSIAWFDRHVIDGTMNALAYVTNFFSVKIKGMQSGYVQAYVLWYLSLIHI